MRSLFWIVIVAIICWISCNDTARFDARKWRVTDCLEDSYTADTYREYVVDDLVEKILPGMSRDSVLLMLGAPDRNDTLPTWCLGPQSPLRTKFDWLTLHFSQDGRFECAELWGDH